MDFLVDILNKLTEIEIINVFLNANVLNVVVILSFIYLFSRMIVSGVTKPQTKQNELLGKLFDKFNQVVEADAVKSKLSDDRDEKYVSMIIDVKNTISNGQEIIRSDIKEVNNTLIEHNSYRCRDAIKVVKFDEKEK